MGLVLFSTQNIPRRDRASRYRDVLNDVLQLELESLDGTTLEVEARLRRLPGMVLASTRLSPLAMIHTASHAAEGNDDFVISLPTAGRASYGQRGRDEAEREPGSGQLLLNDEASVIRNGQMTRLSLAISRADLAPRIADLDAVLANGIPASPALSYLVSYVGMLTAEVDRLPPGLEQVAASHVLDLVAMALGPTRDAAGEARGRGVRAARFSAIKADIGAGLRDPHLSLPAIAARHGISVQYARSLFNAEGTTFSDYVVGERLAQVHRMLVSPRYSDRSISSIVYACGFGDLSYFNRVFRRTYGVTPSEAREAARHAK